MYDLIIKNGQLYDGTGNPATQLDLAIKAGKIARIGNLTNEQASEVIDAKGLAVAPGFIDAHSHSDLLCIKPEIQKAKLLQGVTTELLGQDGISVAPVSDKTRPLWQQQLKALNGDIGDWPWESVAEYLNFLETSKIPCNALYLVPHGAVRSLVMGFEERTATKAEMEQMRILVEEAMEQGAVGISTGLEYTPNLYSDTEELIEICKGSAKYNGSLVVHIRNEDDDCLEALDEVVEVARQSGVRLHISHFKVGGEGNRDKYEIFLNNMDEARKEGIEVTFDQYPYVHGSTVLLSLLPAFMHAGGTGEMLKRLKDPAARQKVKDIYDTPRGYKNLRERSEWKKITVNSVATDANRHLEGKTMDEVADIRGQEPFDAMFDLLLEEDAAVTMIVEWGLEEDAIYGMKHHLQMIGSDGIFGGKPHPRVSGTFPRILGKYVREEKAFTLAEAIRKMTAAPAQLLRLKDRGLLKEGYFADIVIFDPDRIADGSTYEEPLKEPIGIDYVIVNGHVTIKQNEYQGALAGKVIRRQDTLTK